MQAIGFAQGFLQLVGPVAFQPRALFQRPAIGAVECQHLFDGGAPREALKVRQPGSIHQVAASAAQHVQVGSQIFVALKALFPRIEDFPLDRLGVQRVAQRRPFRRQD